jgi:hypothetical protein
MNQRSSTQTLARFARCAADRLPAALEDALATNPLCPVTRYLLGCACLDRQRPALAVRHMMVAHRNDPQLQSAALLAFAGLNWINTPATPLLPVLVETWEEFRRPEFDRHRRERRLLDAFAEPDPGLGNVTPLARRLWRLPIPMLRAQIREAIASRDANLYSLLAVTA